MPLLANGGLTYNSTQALTRDDSGLGFSLFTRRYLGNRCCFLFHRLVICLSSAGRSWIAEVGKNKEDVMAVRANPTRPLVSKAEALYLSQVNRSCHGQYPSRRWIRFIDDTQQPMSKAETRSQMRSTT